MHKLLSVGLVLLFAASGCITYTKNFFPATIPQTTAVPAYIVLPNAVSSETTEIASKLFSGKKPGYKVRVVAQVHGPTSTRLLEYLGLLTLCILPCGSHVDIAIAVDYSYKGHSFHTERYDSTHQGWGGLVVGVYLLDSALKDATPAIDGLVRALLPHLQAQAVALLPAVESMDKAADQSEQRKADALAWVKAGMPTDNIIDSTNDLVAAHFNCLDFRNILHCQETDAEDEFDRSTKQTRFAHMRGRKYFLYFGQLPAPGEYDFSRQNIPLPIVSQQAGWRWEENVFYYQTNPIPFLPMPPAEAKAFKQRRPTDFALGLIAEIIPETAVRTRFRCMNNRAEEIAAVAKSPDYPCYPSGSVTIKQLLLKPIRWVILDQNGKTLYKRGP